MQLYLNVHLVIVIYPLTKESEIAHASSAKTMVFRVLLQDRRYLQRELRNEFLIRVGMASHISCMNACYPLLSSTVTYLVYQ
jgi:hypothetical protein